MRDTFNELLHDIRTRVRPYCDDMSDVAFDAMTQRMAEIEFKYSQRHIGPPTPPPGTSRSPDR